MITFKKIKYKNFLSTGNTPIEIDLHRSNTTLIVGTNGSGKSTLLDALCFVLFLDSPKELEKEAKEFEGTSVQPGSLLFEYTQQARPRWSTTGASAFPKTGDFYMFPALLQHWVCPFKSKVTRISVSGNLRITNRDKLPRDYF